MHDVDMRTLKVRLLRGGVAPRHVKRTLRELRHHLADLEQCALAAGLSPEKAAAQAREQIGDREQIVQATLARPELKSWAYRCPWAVYGILPAVGLALAIVGSILLCVGILTLAQAMSGLGDAAFGQALAARQWVLSMIGAWAFATIHLLPVVFAGLLCVMAARRDAPLLWPAFGVLLILLLGFCSNLSFSPPQMPGGQGELRAGIGFSTEMLLQMRTLGLLLTSACILVPYYLWRRRQWGAAVG